MKPRASVSLLGVLVGVLSVAMAGPPALAQAGGLAAQQAVPGSGLGDLLANPGEWATTMFNAALIGIGQKTTSDVVGFMGWLLGNGNLISQTPPGLSYGSEAVGRLWGTMRLVANAGLAVVTVWGGVNLITRATSTTGVWATRHKWSLCVVSAWRSPRPARTTSSGYGRNPCKPKSIN